MKNKVKLFGIIALFAVIGFGVIGCPNEPKSGGTPTDQSIASNQVSYVSGTHEIVISQSPLSSRAFSPKTGNNYTWFDGVERVTWGTIVVSGSNNYTFNPAPDAQSLGALPFIATLSNGELTGVVDKDSGGPIVLQTDRIVSITSMSWGPIGYWIYSETVDGQLYKSILNVTATNWTWNLSIDDHVEAPANGTYSTVGNTYKDNDGLSSAYLKNRDTLVVTIKTGDIYDGDYNYQRQQPQ